MAFATTRSDVVRRPRPLGGGGVNAAITAHSPRWCHLHNETYPLILRSSDFCPYLVPPSFLANTTESQDTKIIYLNFGSASKCQPNNAF
jgi:hypothetical protein